MKKKATHLPDSLAKAKFVRDGFNAIASRYDLLNDIMTLGLHRRWKNQAINLMQVREGMRVLDLCAGTGDLTFRSLPKVGSGGLVVALDFSHLMMIEGLKRTESHEGLSIPSWLSGDACDLPFCDESFDGAVVGFGLRNVTHLKQTLREVHRVLKSGAFFVSLDTAETEWRVLAPCYRIFMSRVIPTLGKMLGGNQAMYRYLSDSASAFQKPLELQKIFEQVGFNEAGYCYRPRIVGGAALVWGRKNSA